YAARLAFARLDPGAVLPRLPHVEASGQLAFRGEGGAHRLRGEVRTPLGEAALQGRLAPGTPPAYHLAARVSLPRLAALDARAGLTRLGPRLGQPVAGTASLSASAAGPLGALAARASVTVEHPLYGALGADRARARLALDGLGSGAPHGTLHLEAPALRVARAAPADALADLEWRRAGDTDRARLSAPAMGEDRHPQAPVA